MGKGPIFLELFLVPFCDTIYLSRSLSPSHNWTPGVLHSCSQTINRVWIPRVPVRFFQ